MGALYRTPWSSPAHDLCHFELRENYRYYTNYSSYRLLLHPHL